MAPLLAETRLLLLPDVVGSGMKLRVAEALSMGVPTVGTDKGLRGYEQIDRFGRVVADARDVLPAARDLLADENTAAGLAAGAIDSWRTDYAIDVFSMRLHRILAALGSRRSSPGADAATRGIH
jgi:glycosyltransferase involved in cell wall biosynthesis